MTQNNFASILDIFKGDTAKMARIAHATNHFVAALRLWQLWMVLTILSVFVVTWLVFFGVLAWVAIPAVAVMLLGGLIARPALPKIEVEPKEEEDVRDNA